jgi:hypothetical protein
MDRFSAHWSAEDGEFVGAPPPDISSCRSWTPGREAALAGIRQLVADVEGED